MLDGELNDLAAWAWRRTWALVWAGMLAVGIALALASCARPPEVAQHTVAEYRANADLRREVFARCTNDPGTLGKTPDCVNAREAERLEAIGSVRNTAPLGLPRPRGRP